LKGALYESGNSERAALAPNFEDNLSRDFPRFKQPMCLGCFIKS
jgi:hypothetical protein